MKSITLVGFMGAGKTATGTELARMLNLPFLDLDEEIEKREARTIYEIFAQEGEHYFRKQEWKTLQELGAGDRVLAIGGGTFTVDENINLINSRSCSVWLTCPLEICLERIAKEPGQRPLFNDPEEFARLYRHRLQFYRRARYHVDSSPNSPEEVAVRVMEKLGLEATGG